MGKASLSSCLLHPVVLKANRNPSCAFFVANLFQERYHPVESANDVTGRCSYGGNTATGAYDTPRVHSVFSESENAD